MAVARPRRIGKPSRVSRRRVSIGHGLEFLTEVRSAAIPRATPRTRPSLIMHTRMASGKKAAARERASGADGRAGRWKTRPGCRSLYRAFMIALVAWPSIAAPEMPERPWHVLILEAYDPWLPATIQLDQAMRRALHDDTSRLTDVYTEALDTGRFRGRDLEDAFLGLLRKKYGADTPDVILAGAPFALDFAVRHRTELWPEARIVFYGVPSGAAPLTLPPDVTGQYIQYDAAGTVALALRLSPAVRRILVIGGVTESDQGRVRSAIDAAARLSPGIDIVRLDKLPYSEILRVLEKQPIDSFAIFAGFYRDVRGDTFLPADVVEKLSSASTVPIYSVFGSMLGHGIVGGALTDFERVGRQAGELAAGVLSGRISPSAAPRPASAASCVVDARQMARWSLPEARLPPGCSVAFRVPGMWETYRWQVAGGIGLILLQALLIGGLLFQRRQRRRATLEVHQIRAALTHASRLATVGELTAAISHEINQPLGAVQSNADAVEMLLDAHPPRLDRVRDVLADIRAANLRASEVVRRLRALLQKHELAMQSMDLNDAVNAVLRLVATEARRREVTLDAALVARPLRVRGDSVQLQQVVLNLLMNAMEAMTDTPASRRRIRIRTSITGREAFVHVDDGGRGIDRDQLPHLFESFYTTKANGLGLGLSIARSIVRAHGGRIQSENNAGGGATFVVAIPAERGDSDRSQRKADLAGIQATASSASRPTPP